MIWQILEILVDWNVLRIDDRSKFQEDLNAVFSETRVREYAKLWTQMNKNISWIEEDGQLSSPI